MRRRINLDAQREWVGKARVLVGGRVGRRVRVAAPFKGGWEFITSSSKGGAAFLGRALVVLLLFTEQVVGIVSKEAKRRRRRF